MFFILKPKFSLHLLMRSRPLNSRDTLPNFSTFNSFFGFYKDDLPELCNKILLKFRRQSISYTIVWTVIGIDCD